MKDYQTGLQLKDSPPPLGHGDGWPFAAESNQHAQLIHLLKEHLSRGSQFGKTFGGIFGLEEGGVRRESREGSLPLRSCADPN